ncbi:Bacterial type II secretion system protein F domain protein [Pseudobythopirellula maris]|uniref:Bacterial type II secretion system protein F domain protein n=1 Tax=Pseudobythopirellula maris TaxID=2527991 RepID=A0A5C5ZTU2_9BACT|nr:type II secretion system F family protein [Pseudobythopirellula maris]TWT90670.1 Bacterial type II secretion system protein F domain protein [Pseudobythopirellula maris]
MSLWIIYLGVFGCVAALVVVASSFMKGDKEAEVAQRLTALTGGKNKGAKGAQAENDLMAESWNRGAGAIEQAIANHLNLKLMFEQADVSYTVSQFLTACVVAALVGFFGPTACGLPAKFAPIISVIFVFLPFAWLIMKRKRRLKKFGAQLPEALELIARALRAGHSLAAGLNLVASEMSNPIAKEFGRTFEEQNLGTPMEEALGKMTERIPNLDLKFFVTAIVLQRQTGGDLAEILDKIGRLIRERFKIFGQVQALTGEGRMSGIVLLALPPMLFVAVYRMNPDYLMLLFTDDLGKKMLVGGIVMQLLGAVVIQKIINIRV